MQRFDNYDVPRKVAAGAVKGALLKVVEERNKASVQSRMVSLLQGQLGVKTLDLPKSVATDPSPSETVGISLTPGFHVVEIASQKLGTSLLDEGHGTSRTMYMRTSTPATNLAVHFKLGFENAMAWVTSQDKGV